MARHRGAAAFGEEIETVIEAEGDAVKAELRDAGGGQFDGQRQAIEADGEFGDGLGVGVGDGEGGVGGAGALGEQAGGGIIQHGGGGGVRQRGWDGQRGEALHPFAGGAQRFAAGGENVDFRGTAQHGFRHGAGGGDEVFAIIQQQQKVF